MEIKGVEGAMEIGRFLVVLGLALTVCGLVLLMVPRGWEAFSWFGRLPGDIHYKGDRTVVWIPITSMILLSVALRLVSWLVQRFSR